jgi:acetylornithine/LysW-gamma-L-lysine aminotransferase
MIVRGQGARVWDADGREYIDCVAGIGVAGAGHCHPAIADAISEQAHRLVTGSEMFYNDKRAEMYERLATMVPEGIERFFLCNSGSEATEAAIKFARLTTGRPGIIAATGAFHGRTLGALSATFRKEYRDPFGPLVPGFSHVKYDDIEKLEAAVNDQTAAVILEVIQGEGGVIACRPEYLRAARELCDRHGAMLIVDEVQTGFGRTGKWFATQHHGVTPDLIAMGKAIAGGVPMGAVGMGERVTGLKPGVHGSTFGGNPLACAASAATLMVYQTERLDEHAAEMGAYLRGRLEEINSPLIKEVRGMGLLVGIELKIRAARVVEAMMARGVLALTAGTTVLRLLPPLVIGPRELDTVVEALYDTLIEVSGSPSEETSE